MQEYVWRLCLCGMSERDASVIVSDFERDNDLKGLAAYLVEFERLHAEAMKYVEIIQPKSCKSSCG